MNKYMRLAFDEALLGMEAGDGGPFGAVVADSATGEVIACEHNRVLQTNDPTMHAEIAAIRAACAKLGRFSLHDCVIYSSCMPCPMCMSAVMWAKIPKLYYGATAEDAAGGGFDDEYMYRFIKDGFADGTKLVIENIDAEECKELFTHWNNKKSRTMY